MQALLADLRRDEGLRLEAYQDTAGNWTIGYGHKLTAPGNPIIEPEAETMLADDVNFVCFQLDDRLDWWRGLADNAQRGLANQCYNLGFKGLQGFTHMLTALEAHDYETAAAEALASEWATQVGDRAKRIAVLYQSCAKGPDNA